MRKLIKKNEDMEMCGISSSTLYRLIKSGQFPNPVKTSERSVAWIENEVSEWIELRILARDSQQTLSPGIENDKLGA